jgi:hypothetical protein
MTTQQTLLYQSVACIAQALTCCCAYDCAALPLLRVPLAVPICSTAGKERPDYKGQQEMHIFV